MNTTFRITFFVMILLSVKATAQYGGGMYGNGMYGNNGMNGMNSGRPSGMQNTPSKPDAAAIEKQNAEKIDQYMETLKTDLELDELQYIAIKNEITSNKKNVDLILKKEKSEEEKSKEIKASLEKTDNEITTFLNPDQKDKYKKIISERGIVSPEKKTKTKSKKNKDKNKEEEEEEEEGKKN